MAPRYMVDNMFNRLAQILKKEGIECETSTFMIRGDRDSSKSIRDAKLFRYLFENSYNLVPKNTNENVVTLITVDKDLVAYCAEFEIPCIYEEKPNTRKEFNEMAEGLVKELLDRDKGST